MIVGFPGETDADFEATCRVVREVGFARVHVFSFSRRDGTPAATLPDQVPAAVVVERRRQLLELERETAETYASSLLGRTLDVLVEGDDPTRPGLVVGTSCRYVPVAFPGHLPSLLRKRLPVRIQSVEGDVLRGGAETPSFRLPLT